MADIASLFGRFGLENAVLRFISTAASESDWVRVRTISQHAILLVLLAGYGYRFGVSGAIASFVLASVVAAMLGAQKFAALHHQGGHAALAQVAIHSACLTLLVAGPVLLALVMVASFFMGLLGSGFEAGTTVLIVLVMGQMVNVATGSVGQILAMTGHEKIIRNIFWLTTGLNLGLNIVLIPWLGMMGGCDSVGIFCCCKQSYYGLIC